MSMSYEGELRIQPPCDPPCQQAKTRGSLAASPAPRSLSLFRRSPGVRHGVPRATQGRLSQAERDHPVPQTDGGGRGRPNEAPRSERAKRTLASPILVALHDLSPGCEVSSTVRGGTRSPGDRPSAASPAWRHHPSRRAGREWFVHLRPRQESGEHSMRSTCWRGSYCGRLLLRVGPRSDRNAPPQLPPVSCLLGSTVCQQHLGSRSAQSPTSDRQAKILHLCRSRSQSTRSPRI